MALHPGALRFLYDTRICNSNRNDHVFIVVSELQDQRVSGHRMVYCTLLLSCGISSN